jgi:hypothetical protein
MQLTQTYWTAQECEVCTLDRAYSYYGVSRDLWDRITRLITAGRYGECWLALSPYGDREKANVER